MYSVPMLGFRIWQALGDRDSLKKSGSQPAPSLGRRQDREAKMRKIGTINIVSSSPRERRKKEEEGGELFIFFL